MAGQAYVEQFGQETFQRAENTMKANKVSRCIFISRQLSQMLIVFRQTADTFQAAATFLELCQIWGPLDPEIASKIKFAKYHALRIAKAIKAGNDPNMTNPTPEPSPNLEKPSLDNNDPDVRMLNGTSNPSLQPSVEESPEDHSFQQPGPSQGPSPQDENYYHTSAGAEVSPLAPPSDNRAMSEGGGYFPSVPDESTSSVRVGTVPEETTGAEVVTPPLLTHDILHPTPHSLDGIHAASQSTLKHLNMSPSLPPSVSTTDQSQPHGLPKDTTQLNTMQPMPRHPQTAHGHASNPTAIRSLRDDEVSVAAAQKHAKFAISALNFEDVKTAVKELEDALEVLGAR